MNDELEAMAASQSAPEDISRDDQKEFEVEPPQGLVTYRIATLCSGLLMTPPFLYMYLGSFKPVTHDFGDSLSVGLSILFVWGLSILYAPFLVLCAYFSITGKFKYRYRFDPFMSTALCVVPLILFLMFSISQHNYSSH